MEIITKFRHVMLFTLVTIIVAACNFTLAEDITPPPGYVSPTPAPTLGPLYPAQAPNVENGAAIFAEKCAPCHGQTGMGDGAQGIQLGVTVPAFALSEVARSASLAQWFTIVTRGNIERFMPPFLSLSDQERWDVVAYAMTLHTTPADIEKGRQLFEANCANCSIDFFKDQLKISSLSEVELARIVKEGNDEVKAFGSSLSDDEVWAVAAFLRSLSFETASVASASTPPPPTEAATVVVTPLIAETTTPPAEEALVEGTAQADVTSEATAVSLPGFGTVIGSVENKTGAELPSDLKITLRGFDHGANQNAGPQEVLTLEETLNKDGTFAFEHVEMPKGRIFTAELTHEGATLKTEFGVVEEGASTLTLSPLILYSTTTDTSLLVMDEVRLFFDYGDTDIQVFGVYSFRNTAEKTIVVTVKGQAEIPFIKSPEGTQPLGYEPMQDSQPFVNTDNGLAIPPSDKPYGLIVFYNLARASQVKVSQSFALPVSALTVFLPEGVKAEGAQMTDHGVQAIQGFNFQMYATGNIGAGDAVTFTLTGAPKDSSASASIPGTKTNTDRNFLVGAGALGVALIIAGAWMYLRDRNHIVEEETNLSGDHEFESAEELMDAIIALDDLHQAKKISDEAYQKRRSELKDALKEMM